MVYRWSVHIELASIVVDDQDDAIDFFVGTLGFELIEDSPALTNDGRPKRWIVVRPPGATTGLLVARADGEQQARAVGNQFGGRVGLFLRVDDFDVAFQRLVDAGIEIVGPPRQESYGRVAVFVDPFGNKWDLLGPPVPADGELDVDSEAGGGAEPVIGTSAARGAAVIRRERPGDEPGARAVQAAAFDQGAGEPVEARLLDGLRACGAWLPALSWVGEIDGVIVGHNVCTRGFVDDVAAVGLGPIGVAPEHQGTGIGSRLMWAMIGAADATGEPLIALLGNPDYYERFGFRPSTELGIEAPDPAWGRHFQVRPLSAWTSAIGGRFRYAAPFDGV